MMPDNPQRRCGRRFPPGVTTVVVWNVPQDVGDELLMQYWPPSSESMPYNLLYVPQKSVMVLLNFLTADAANRFRQRWHGAQLPGLPHRPLAVEPAKCQGFEANLRFWRQRRVERLRPECWPRLFDEHGQALDFRQVIRETVAELRDQRQSAAAGPSE